MQSLRESPSMRRALAGAIVPGTGPGIGPAGAAAQIGAAGVSLVAAGVGTEPVSGAAVPLVELGVHSGTAS